jgi:hypothetical protein
MKFWLIVFIMSSNGTYLGKTVTPYVSKPACEQAARAIRGEPKLEIRCVSDDHYSGRKQDPGVPYD